MMRELTLEKTNKIIKDSGWNHDLFQKEIMRIPTLSGFIIAYLANRSHNEASTSNCHEKSYKNAESWI